MHAPLSSGDYPLAPGQLANIVIHLEMTERPAVRAAPAMPGLSLERMGAADTERFRALFRAIGQEIMWFSRLMMEEEKLAAIIGDPCVFCYAAVRDGVDIGLVELDFRKAGQCELSFFGLVPSAVGGGIGRFLMNEALSRAWAQPITRMWVHTCHFDHPSALAFYQRSGFRPCQMMVEVHPDPRLTGHMPRHASPQVPLID